MLSKTADLQWHHTGRTWLVLNCFNNSGSLFPWSGSFFLGSNQNHMDHHDSSFITQPRLSMVITTNLLKTLWEMKKMLVTSIYSFFHNFSTLPKLIKFFFIKFISSHASNASNLDYFKRFKS